MLPQGRWFAVYVLYVSYNPHSRINHVHSTQTDRLDEIHVLDTERANRTPFDRTYTRRVRSVNFSVGTTCLRFVTVELLYIRHVLRTVISAKSILFRHCLTFQSDLCLMKEVSGARKFIWRGRNELINRSIGINVVCLDSLWLKRKRRVYAPYAQSSQDDRDQLDIQY